MFITKVLLLCTAVDKDWHNNKNTTVSNKCTKTCMAGSLRVSPVIKTMIIKLRELNIHWKAFHLNNTQVTNQLSLIKSSMAYAFPTNPHTNVCVSHSYSWTTFSTTKCIWKYLSLISAMSTQRKTKNNNKKQED